jgi:hypothetical protein
MQMNAIIELYRNAGFEVLQDKTGRVFVGLNRSVRAHEVMSLVWDTPEEMLVEFRRYSDSFFQIIVAA